MAGRSAARPAALCCVGPCGWGWSVHQHDLSAGVAALAQLVRGGGLGERERRRDRHPQPALRRRARPRCARPCTASGSAAPTAVAGSSAGAPCDRWTPWAAAVKSAIVTTRAGSPAMAIRSGSAPPAQSNTASTPPGASARTRSTRPAPYVVGCAPSERRKSWLCSLGRTDDGGAAGERELDGDGAHPAGRALHQHGVPGADREPVEDPGGRLDAARGAARLLPAPRGRFRRPGGQDRVSRRWRRARSSRSCRTPRRRHSTPVTPAPTSSTTPAASNPVRYGNVVGHHVTQHPGADVRLSRRESGRPYGDADRARPGVRLLDLGDMHHAGRAVLGELNSSHAPDRNGTPRPFG